MQVGRADGIAHKENLRRALARLVVKAALQRLNNRAGPKVAAANANHHQHLAVLLYFLCRRLDAGKLFFIVIFRQVYPAKEIAARAGFRVQCLVRQGHLRENG